MYYYYYYYYYVIRNVPRSAALKVSRQCPSALAVTQDKALRSEEVGATGNGLLGCAAEGSSVHLYLILCLGGNGRDGPELRTFHDSLHTPQ
jgi:hypothetical protein